MAFLSEGGRHYSSMVLLVSFYFVVHGINLVVNETLFNLRAIMNCASALSLPRRRFNEVSAVLVL